NRQYKKAKIKRDEVDTGALILTGVAVRRRNARAIGEVFAQEAGKFVAVSAGDGLEAAMAAHCSGAVARSGRACGVVWYVGSGGVSEFIYNREKTNFGDLGPLIADEIHRRIPALGMLVMEPTARIRATVIGASQYTIQVSGNTIFITPEDAVPVRNVPVVAPE